MMSRNKFILITFFKRICCYGGQLENQMVHWPSYSSFNINSMETFTSLTTIYKVCNLALVKVLRKNKLNLSHVIRCAQTSLK